MNALGFIKTNGFNGMTAMNIANYLVNIYSEQTEEDYLKEYEDVTYAVEEFCTLNNIDDKLKKEFISVIDRQVIYLI